MKLALYAGVLPIMLDAFIPIMTKAYNYSR